VRAIVERYPCPEWDGSSDEKALRASARANYDSRFSKTEADRWF
jgi:hypothetical protein